MTAKVSGSLDLIKAALEMGADGAPMDADHFRRMAALLLVCTDVVRQMEAKLCLAGILPEDLSGTNVVSLKPFLEAKSHARPQL